MSVAGLISMFGYFFEIIWLTEIFFHLIIHCPQVPQGYKGTKVRKLSPVASITVSRNSLNQTYLWHNAMMIVSGEPGQPGLPGSPGEPGLGKSKKNIEIRWIFTKYIMKKKKIYGVSLHVGIAVSGHCSQDYIQQVFACRYLLHLS